MKTHSNFASRFFGIITIGAVGWLQPTAVSGQTPEGAVITNIANVSYDDANGNNYASGPASVDVTVGFVAGVDVLRAAAAAAPAVNTTGNLMSFDIKNVGNGTDNVSVTDDITDATVITAITNYRFNSTDYATRAALNVGLAAFPIAAGVTITITVEYTVGANKGGQPSTYTLTATSVRDVGVNDAADDGFTIVTPGLTGTVATTPDGAQLLSHLPSGGASPTYTFTFNVLNSQNGVDDFNLVASFTASAVVSILSVDGVPGTTATISALGAGLNQDVDVIYTVGDVAAGSLDTLFLAATSVANGATNDSGFADMTVVKANLTITKEAWNDVRGALISADVLPGDFIEYKVTITNTGTADATNVHVDDLLPSEVTYISAEGDVALDWGFTILLQDFDADLTPVLVNGSPRVFWIRVQVN